MFLCDTHVHTCFSFDSEMLHGELCGEYIRRGFTSVALTDHYDIDGIESGIYPSYDVKNARIAYERASEEFAGQLDLIWGIELGQPTLRPENACKFIRENGFEFVIGSVHNLDLVPDFIFMNFSRMPQELIEQLYVRLRPSEKSTPLLISPIPCGTSTGTGAISTCASFTVNTESCSE